VSEQLNARTRLSLAEAATFNGYLYQTAHRRLDTEEHEQDCGKDKKENVKRKK
jgi:hypothetical protein